MSESSCFRKPFASQYVHRSWTLLKHSRKHFLPNFLLMLDKLSWKKFHLVRSEILGLCFNTLKEPITRILVRIVRNSGNKLKRNYLPTQKYFSKFFFVFQSYIKIKAFWKKRSASELEYFQSYWLQRMGLLECLMAPVSEHPSAVNVFTRSKHCWNLHGSTFYLIFH